MLLPTAWPWCSRSLVRAPPARWSTRSCLPSRSRVSVYRLNTPGGPHRVNGRPVCAPSLEPRAAGDYPGGGFAAAKLANVVPPPLRADRRSPPTRRSEGRDHPGRASGRSSCSQHSEPPGRGSHQPATGGSHHPAMGGLTSGDYAWLILAWLLTIVDWYHASEHPGRWAKRCIASAAPRRALGSTRRW